MNPRRLGDEIEHNLLKLEKQLGAESLRTLLQETLSYLAAARRRLERHRQQGDWGAIARQMHQLKGSLSIYGNDELARLLEQFQTTRAASERNALVDLVVVRIAEAATLIRSRVGDMET